MNHFCVYSRCVDEKDKREKDLQDLMREERARGRRHVDTDAIAKQKRIEKAIVELAKEIDDEQIFQGGTYFFTETRDRPV